jgi:hypothetical protein
MDLKTSENHTATIIFALEDARKRSEPAYQILLSAETITSA